MLGGLAFLLSAQWGFRANPKTVGAVSSLSQVLINGYLVLAGFGTHLPLVGLLALTAVGFYLIALLAILRSGSVPQLKWRVITQWACSISAALILLTITFLSMKFGFEWIVYLILGLPPCCLAFYMWNIKDSNPT